ncbi:MAG TPA: LapA family protein [Burkholderiales bacterium]|nr:LapA family protein [Burkholderiales bacterium]
MRFFTWAIRLVVFLLLVAFAAKNIEPVELRFYFGMALEAPLVTVLFASFALGALFGILALLGTVLRQRGEISRLRKKPYAEEPTLPPPGL